MAFEHYDKCSLLLPMDGANNGTVFTDWSPNPKTVTRNGDAKTVTAQSKYYGSSGYFDGTGDYLSYAGSPAYAVGAGDFTIAAWVYPTFRDTDASIVFSTGRTNVPFYSLRLSISPSGTLVGFISTDGGATQTYVVASTDQAPLNAWSHVAFTRFAGTLGLFLNGSMKATLSAAGVIYYDTSTPVTVGYGLDYDGAYFYGYLQDFMFVNGAALWTSNFDPPARLIGQLTGNVKDYAGANAQRTVVAMPRTTPTRAFTTTSDPSTGNYTLRAPSVESSVILLANEPTLYNDLVHRVTPE